MNCQKKRIELNLSCCCLIDRPLTLKSGPKLDLNLQKIPSLIIPGIKRLAWLSLLLELLAKVLPKLGENVIN